MNPRHYTAWMTNDPSCVPNGLMDVTVIEDEAVDYREEVVSEEYDPASGEVVKETREVPVWESRGAHMFYAETSVAVRDEDGSAGDASVGMREAEALMEKAGWRVVGDWEATPTSYVATVEYVGEYLHIIEQTENAEDPQWFEIRRGDDTEKYDGSVNEYGLEVLRDYWVVNGEATPAFTDEYGNPYFRVLVRTQDDQGTLAVVESSASEMTPAAFKTTRELLGLSDGWLADRLGVSSRTVRNWEAGKYPIPEGVAEELTELHTSTRREIERRVGDLRGEPAPTLVTYRNDADFKAAEPQCPFPAAWHRAMIARVALEVPGARIAFHGE